MSPQIEKLKGLVQEHKKDVILFGVSGILAFIVDFTTLQMVDKFTHHLLLATAAGIFTGFVVSYGLNHLRFKKLHPDARQMNQSLPLFVVLFSFNTLFTFICLDYNERHHFTARIIVKMATVGFIMVWNYVLFHTVIFRGGSQI